MHSRLQSLLELNSHFGISNGQKESFDFFPFGLGGQNQLVTAITAALPARPWCRPFPVCLTRELVVHVIDSGNQGEATVCLYYFDHTFEALLIHTIGLLVAKSKGAISQKDSRSIQKDQCHKLKLT